MLSFIGAFFYSIDLFTEGYLVVIETKVRSTFNLKENI